MDMLTEAHESLDNFLDVTAGIDCRMVPQARRNLARLMEGLQDQRHQIESMKSTLSAVKATPNNNHLISAMSELAQEIKGHKSDTSLDQLPADLDAPCPELAHEHKVALANMSNRRDMMLAMAPGWTHGVAVIVGATIGLMI